MKVVALLILVFSFYAITALQAEDSFDISVPVTSSDLSTPPQTRVTNTWDGSSSTAWATPANWSLNHVPLSTEDVQIPLLGGLTPNYPVVSTTQTCNILGVLAGASLTISTGNLTTNGNCGFYGRLVMNNASGILYVLGNFYMLSGSTNTINSSANIYVQGDIQFASGSVGYLGGNLWTYGSGSSNIITNRATYVLNFGTTKSLGGVTAISTSSSAALTINGLLRVYTGNTLTHPYTGQTILKGDMTVFSGGNCTFDSGVLSMQGDAASAITINGSASYFYNFSVSKDSSIQVNLSTAITVKNYMDINSGILNSNSYTIYLGGNWTNTETSSNFIEGSGTVVINGSGNQIIISETFNILQLNKSGGYMSIPSVSSITCASYDWVAGTLYVYGSFTANDLADPGIFGTLTLGSGTINFHQDASQIMDLCANLTINGGTFNVYGGNTAFNIAYSADATLTMTGGVLDIMDHSIGILTSHTFNDNISGGTIRTIGDFYCNRTDFNPTGGVLELYGVFNHYLGLNTGSNLYDLLINKDTTASIGLDSDITVINNIRIQSGTFGAINHTITIHGDWTNDAGAGDFVPQSSSVIFAGVPGSDIYGTETFNILKLNKPYTGVGYPQLTIPAASNVTCASYDWVAGPLVVYGVLTANDLADPGIFGTINLNSGTINFHQDNAQRMDLRGNLTISGGTFNVYGGNDTFVMSYGEVASLTMTSGVLDIKDHGITDTNVYAFNENISGGTIRTSGAFEWALGDFHPTGGTLDLAGTGTSNLMLAAGCSLYNLNINKVLTSSGANIYLYSNLVVRNDLHILQCGFWVFSGYSITLGGNWTKDSGGYFNAGTGTVTFNKNGSSQTVTGTNTFCNVVDSHTGGTSYLDGIFFNNHTDISGTLTVNHWVIFNIGGATLGNVLNSASTGELIFANNSTSTISSYTGGGGLTSYTSSHIIINDLAQNGIYGSLLTSAGHIEIHQDASQLINLNGNVAIYGNGIIDIYGGSSDCSIAWAGNTSFTMDSGEFNLKNKGIYIGNTSYTCDFNITGGTIRVDSNFEDDRGNFDPTGGVLEVTGSSDSFVYLTPGSWIWTLRVNKVTTREPADPANNAIHEGGSVPINRSCNLGLTIGTIKAGLQILAANEVYLQSDLTCLNAGQIQIANGTLSLNHFTLTSTGDISINANGKLELTGSSILQMSNSKIIYVNSGGRFIATGNATYPSTVTHNSTGYYGFHVESGGQLSAEYATFEYMDNSGVYIKPGAYIESVGAFIQHCIFQNGAAGGSLLFIGNGLDGHIDNVVFPTNTWGGAYNVYKNVSPGTITITNYSGGFSGASHEYDPFNLVNWVGSPLVITDITISHPAPEANWVRLDWTCSVPNNGYTIYYSPTPEGPYTWTGGTMDNFFYDSIDGPSYFYRVVAQLP